MVAEAGTMVGADGAVHTGKAVLESSRSLVGFPTSVTYHVRSNPVFAVLNPKKGIHEERR
jgi:hypothetical protein